MVDGDTEFGRAWRMQRDAAAVGFDWPDISGVLAKVEEETREVREALDANDVAHARLELGDLLFTCVNLARFLETDPEAELRRASKRFESRFALLKSNLRAEGRTFEACSLEELEEVWQRVK